MDEAFLARGAPQIHGASPRPKFASNPPPLPPRSKKQQKPHENKKTPRPRSPTNTHSSSPPEHDKQHCDAPQLFLNRLMNNQKLSNHFLHPKHSQNSIEQSGRSSLSG